MWTAFVIAGWLYVQDSYNLATGVLRAADLAGVCLLNSLVLWGLINLTFESLMTVTVQVRRHVHVCKLIRLAGTCTLS